MNGSRRFYERVNVEKEAVVYINNKEFDVEIKDIAEEGIAFTVNNDNPVLANINISDILKFSLSRFSVLSSLQYTNLS